MPQPPPSFLNVPDPAVIAQLRELPQDEVDLMWALLYVLVLVRGVGADDPSADDTHEVLRGLVNANRHTVHVAVYALAAVQPRISKLNSLKHK